MNTFTRLTASRFLLWTSWLLLALMLVSAFSGVATWSSAICCLMLAACASMVYRRQLRRHYEVELNEDQEIDLRVEELRAGLASSAHRGHLRLIPTESDES